MNKQIRDYLKNYSNDLSIVNKLIVTAYLEFNNLKVYKNEHILSLLKGNNQKEIDNFLNLIRNHTQTFDFEDVINLFEVTIPKKDIVVNGAIYTPKYIREYITNHSLSQSHLTLEFKVADIACGSGAFLYTAAKFIQNNTSNSLYDIYKNNIFGLDISEYAIERTKILLTLFAITKGEDMLAFKFNLFNGNTLNFDWHKQYKNFNGFDSIIGNPPYVRTKNLDVVSKELIKNWKVASSGNTDLYIPFFEIGLKYLKENGCLGYITVNTFKQSVNARALRNFFNNKSINLVLLDFGHHQVFDNKMTYTSIVFCQKNISKQIQYLKLSPSELKLSKDLSFTSIPYSHLDHHNGWLLAEDYVLKNLYVIEKTGIPLGKKMTIKNGLATLNNDIFIFRPYNQDSIYYYMQYNNKEYKIEKNICRNVIKPNKLKNEEEIPRLMEKIIFPYNINENRAQVMNEDFLIDNFPCAFNYLLEHKNILLSRDKGKNSKYKWFEFGRSQSINDFGKKLLFPYMSNKPYFVYSNEEDLMFYAGYAIYSSSERELRILERILKSKIFWYYIEHTSKPYSSNYFALAKNYVKDFGICQLSIEEEDYLLENNSTEEIEEFLLAKYKIVL
jgi:methylase of polypeptide subunit release factors